MNHAMRMTSEADTHAAADSNPHAVLMTNLVSGMLLATFACTVLAILSKLAA